MTNKEIVRNFYDNVFNALDPSRLPEYVVEDYIQHNANVEQGRQGLKNFIEKLTPLKPYHDILLMLEDGDLVAVYSKVCHNDGAAAMIGDFYRLENGMIVEHWDSVQRL